MPIMMIKVVIVTLGRLIILQYKYIILFEEKKIRMMLLRQRSAPSSVPPPDPPILKVVSKILEIDQDLKLFRHFETVEIDLD